MNDEPSSSAAAGISHEANDERPLDVPPTAAELAKRRKTNRQMFNKKRGELLDDLLRSLDVLVFAELSTIYYMDCSFLRFLLRGIVQLVYLTPKPAMFREPPPTRPHVEGILGANALCIILHAIYSAPSAGEATRGYLHGGLAMDFIGQKGPISKLHLLILDLLVVILQLVHLSAHITRRRLKAGNISVTTSTGQQYTPASATQDLDHEERGVRRSEEQQEIEMQTLNPSGASVETAANDPEGSERDTLLSNLAPRSDAHIFDAFNSGQIVLADLDVVKTAKQEFWAHQSSPRDSDPVASGREFGANITAQLLRWRFGAAAGRTVRPV